MRRALVMLVLLGAGSGSALAQMPPERQELLEYQLTLARANQLFAAMDAMKYIEWLVAEPPMPTVADLVAALERSQKAMVILKTNGLTPRDYLVGGRALRMALIAAQGGPLARFMTVSPANLAFASANLAELSARMDAIDTIH